MAGDVLSSPQKHVVLSLQRWLEMMARLPVKNIWFWSPQAQLERSPGQFKNIQRCHKCRNSDCIELIACNSTTAPTTSQRESNNEHVK